MVVVLVPAIGCQSLSGSVRVCQEVMVAVLVPAVVCQGLSGVSGFVRVRQVVVVVVVWQGVSVSVRKEWLSYLYLQ